jgi:hypothetical protein
MEDSELLLLIVIPVVISAIFGYMYFTSKFNTSRSHISQIQKSVHNEKPAHNTQYVPREFGLRTANRRIFNTNKGLRAYSVNTANFPLPGPKTTSN